MNAFETLIADFSEKTGIEIAAGADGSVEIEADGVFVTAQPREQSGDVVMFDAVRESLTNPPDGLQQKYDNRGASIAHAFAGNLDQIC